MNLISVGKITDRGYNKVFRKDSAVVLDNNSEIKMIADHINGLYFVREISEMTSVLSENKIVPQIEWWHKRLGHSN